ncbi:MAG TPA: hypothetical protein VKM55_30700 [Candidatus Lokiarchaeia archaeon]|nr:hypothetical protein [Candidatus Lokiarchaeia archaeon]
MEHKQVNEMTLMATRMCAASNDGAVSIGDNVALQPTTGLLRSQPVKPMGSHKAKT